MGPGSGLNLIARHAERSAAWLAHQSGGLGVGSSNLPAPTNQINILGTLCRLRKISGVPLGWSAVPATVSRAAAKSSHILCAPAPISFCDAECDLWSTAPLAR